jgi:glycosyltransferase involved in cell wall biosynthesis
VTVDDDSHSAGPRVAVIIPCYRDGELVTETVESVREHEPVELVVIDDGSEDEVTRETLHQLESDGVRIVRHESNLGLPAARCTGLAATSAPYVFPLDADDLAEPYVLGQMADRLDKHPEVGVCFGDYAEFGGLERMRAVPERIDPFRLAYTNEYPVSALFRRDVLESVGGWNPIDAYEDWHLWMTLAERGVQGSHLGLGRTTYRRRVHRQRMLAAARASHSRLYARLRADHPRLFDELGEHRRRSPLDTGRKLFYPVIYGRRPRFSWDHKVKALLERLGIWTLKR